MSKIIRNRIKCKKCQDIIESKDVHDFQTCKCGAVSVDGGQEYQRLLWPSGDMSNYIERLVDE